MSSTERAILLAVIWFSMALAAIGVGAESTQPELIAIPIAVALLMTVVLAILPDIVAAITTQREKAKRQPQDRLSLLMDLMDADERAAFRETLKQRVLADMDRPHNTTDDGELPAQEATLAALLDENRARQHTRQD